MKKLFVKIILTVTFISAILPTIIGCTTHREPKAWVSVEKPPIRVIYVDYSSDIQPATVHKITQQVSRLKFEDYDFNENTTIGIDVAANINSTVVTDHSLTIQP